jgi:hypothetical protein
MPSNLEPAADYISSLSFLKPLIWLLFFFLKQVNASGYNPLC